MFSRTRTPVLAKCFQFWTCVLYKLEEYVVHIQDQCQYRILFKGVHAVQHSESVGIFFLMKLSLCNAALLPPPPTHTKRKIHIQSDSRYINDFTPSNYNVMAQRKRDCKKKGTTVEQRSTQFQTYSS